MKTSVLKVGGLLSSLGARGVEKRLRRVAGVEEVSVNAVGGAALIAYDQEVTGPATLKRAIEGCGYNCPGEATPHHLTARRRHTGVAVTAQTTTHRRHSPRHDHSRAATPTPPASQSVEHEKAAQTLGSSQAPATAVQPADKGKTVHAGHESAADIAQAATLKPAAPSAQTAPSGPSEAPVAPDPESHSGHAQQSDATAREMGHGEGHDMQSMARDMRNRFWIALAFSLPVFAYSPMGMPFTLRPPFGLGLNLFLFQFASAAILYPVWPFVVAAFRAIRSGVEIGRASCRERV